MALERGKTFDKMTAGHKSANSGAANSGRKHLTGREVERLIEATRGGMNEARDRCLLLLMFRHGLRVSEACGIKLDQVDTESRVLHVFRLKGGLSTTQPLRGDELRAIHAWLKERARLNPAGKTFFVSGQRMPLHRSTVNLALRKYSAAASRTRCSMSSIRVAGLAMTAAKISGSERSANLASCFGDVVPSAKVFLQKTAKASNFDFPDNAIRPHPRKLADAIEAHGTNPDKKYSGARCHKGTRA